MKAILSIILSALLILSASARDMTLAWDPNPVADAVTSYRLERLSGDAWVIIGTVSAQAAGVAPQLRIPDFPDAKTSVRCIAINAIGESEPSEILVIGQTATAPKGLRFKVNPR